MEIKKVCVLGAGLMGNGIAQVCAQAGYEVTMRDIEQRFIDGGMNTIKKESQPRCGKRQNNQRSDGFHSWPYQTHSGFERSGNRSGYSCRSCY